MDMDISITCWLGRNKRIPYIYLIKTLGDSVNLISAEIIHLQLHLVHISASNMNATSVLSLLMTRWNQLIRKLESF